MINNITSQLNHFNDFAKISLSTYKLSNFNINQQQAINAISNEIEEEFKELNSEAVKESRCNYFKIPNVEKDHYAEYAFDISDKGKLICGIRHFGGQADKAFVNILSNFKTSKKDLIEIYKTNLSQYFKSFNPKYLRYFSRDEIKSNEINNSYLVQNALSIKTEIQYQLENDINLISPDNDDYYKAYSDEYTNFHEKNPELKNKVQCNDVELMEESRNAGLLKELEYEGKVIGLIAGMKEEFLGHPGIYLIEILVNENYKKRGFAKAMQRKFIQEVCKEDEIVWGTIDRSNIASLKTAKANLREEIRFENFVQI